MIEFICEGCGDIKRKKYNPDLEGKKIKLICKECNHANLFIYTRVDPKNKTIINEINLQIIKGGYLLYTPFNGMEQRFDLSIGINIIGRKSSSQKSDISIPSKDKTMSRTHCVIISKVDKQGNWQFILKDYNSANFTKLNSKILIEDEALFLIDGDKIQLGKSIIIFKEKQ